jgi:S1-C subfamily serine protease
MKTLLLSLSALLLASTSAIADLDSRSGNVRSYRIKCGTSIGSGFFLQDSKTFVTARHVVESCNAPMTVHDGYSQIGVLSPLYESQRGDLYVGAVYNLDHKVRTYSLSCQYPKFGSVVYSYGHAEGQILDTSLRGNVRTDPHHKEDHSNDIIVTNKYIPGMSGGPVTNAQGNVVGVVRWTYVHHKEISGFASIVPVCNLLRDYNVLEHINRAP